MSKVIITLEDTDLDSGEFTIAIDVEGSKIDDGQMTAAHLTANFIKANIHTPGWHKAVWAYAESLVAQNEGVSIGNACAAPANDIGDAPGAIAR